MTAAQDDKLITTFKQQQQLCENLLRCSQQQLPLINTDRYTELLDVIALKQRLLEQWDQLKEQQPHLIKLWKKRREEMPVEKRQTCEKLLTDIESFYEQLLQEEQQSTETLTFRKTETQQQLNDISNAAHAHHAYRDQSVETTHRYLDVDQ